MSLAQSLRRVDFQNSLPSSEGTVQQAEVPPLIRWREETNAYGRPRVEGLGIREDNVDRLINEHRQNKHFRENRK